MSRAAARIGVLLMMSFNVDGSGRLASGPSVSDAASASIPKRGPRPTSQARTCFHTVWFEPSLIDGDWMTRLDGFRANASKMEKIAVCRPGHLEEGDPQDLGRRIAEMAQRFPHMDVWGGCCGTGDVHLDEIADNGRRVSEPLDAP